MIYCGQVSNSPHSPSASRGLFFFLSLLFSPTLSVLSYLYAEPDIHMHEFNNETTIYSTVCGVFIHAVNLRVSVYTHGSV